MKLIYSLLLSMLVIEVGFAKPSKVTISERGLPTNSNGMNHVSPGKAHELISGSTQDIEKTGGTLIYETKSIDNIPSNIQAFIKERGVPNPSYISELKNLDTDSKELLASKNELSFTSCSVYALPDNSKRYEVFVKYFGMTDLPLIFDENFNLIWVGNFNRLESIGYFDDLLGGNSKISQEELDIFNSQIDTNAEFKGFEIANPTSNSQASLNTYAGVKSYEFTISKEGINGLETRVLRYDGNRKLISTYYSVQ